MNNKPLPASITDDKVLFVVNGETYWLKRGSEYAADAIDAISQGDARRAIEAASLAKQLEVGLGEHVKVKGTTVYYDGVPVHNAIEKRILDFVEHKYDYTRLKLFMEDVYANPSPRAREELFPFLENKGMPITDDGCFLGYKVVVRHSDGSLWDKYGETVRNNIGDKPWMKRELTDTWGIDCGQGFHVGNLAYSGPSGFYNNGSTDVVIIVKVNPRDVVSVPQEGSTAQKLRCNTYEVIDIYRGELDDVSFGETPKRKADPVREASAVKKVKEVAKSVKSKKSEFKPGSWKDIVAKALRTGDATSVMAIIYSRVKDELNQTKTLTTNQQAKVRQILQQIAVKDSKGRWRLKK